MTKHDEIDKAIKNEKRRVKIISRNFEILDAIIGVGILSFFMFLALVFSSMTFKYPDQAYGPYEWVFVLSCGISLAISASYISKSVKQSTGRK